MCAMAGAEARDTMMSMGVFSCSAFYIVSMLVSKDFYLISMMVRLEFVRIVGCPLGLRLRLGVGRLQWEREDGKSIR